MNDPVFPQSVADLRSDIASLRSLVQVSVVASLIATTSPAVYQLWQYRQVRRELGGQAKTFEALRSEHGRQNQIAERFREYGAQDKNFVPILDKVGLKPLDPTSGSPPATSPGPQTTAPKR
ncbi:MAG: hypothetical protein EXS36_00100 [Pedosphaera sp.]|nr:hypothetical protein [Pedosphaera sp.]